MVMFRKQITPAQQPTRGRTRPTPAYQGVCVASSDSCRNMEWEINDWVENNKFEGRKKLPQEVW